MKKIRKEYVVLCMMYDVYNVFISSKKIDAEDESVETKGTIDYI